MSAKLELEAARHQLGLTSGVDLVKVAEASILAGSESESLVLLAGEVDPIMSDAAPLFERGLRDLHIDVPDTGTACWVVLRHHIERIASNDVNPREGVQAILNEVYYPGGLDEMTDEFMGDSHDIHHMFGYYFGIDDIMERPDEVSCDGKFGAEGIAAVEARIRGLAIKWLTDHRIQQGDLD